MTFQFDISIWHFNLTLRHSNLTFQLDITIFQFDITIFQFDITTFQFDVPIFQRQVRGSNWNISSNWNNYITSWNLAMSRGSVMPLSLQDEEIEYFYLLTDGLVCNLFVKALLHGHRFDDHTESLSYLYRKMYYNYQYFWEWPCQKKVRRRQVFASRCEDACMEISPFRSLRFC